MRPLTRLLIMTALTAALAMPVQAQEVQIVRLSQSEASPLLGGVLLALLMLGVGGLGPDTRQPGPGPTPPDKDYAPPGGYQGDLRPRYVVGVTPYEGDPEIGTGGDRAGFETPEYQASWGLTRLNAAARYAEGAFGAGALISVFDSGVDPDHPELADAYLAEQSHSYFTDGMMDLDGHGTNVAGIISAARDGSPSQGSAPRTRTL
jgi:subtilisin family serine protease